MTELDHAAPENAVDAENAENAYDDYDIFAGQYAEQPFQLWTAIRESGCPVAHSERYGGSWCPVGFEDIWQICRETSTYSSRAIEVGGRVPRPGAGLPTPPVTSDPPDHKAYRDVLMPFFTPAKVAEREPFIRNLARELIAEFRAAGGGDAVAGYAQHLPMAVLAELLGVAQENRARFIDWTVRILRVGPTDQQVREQAIAEVLAFLEPELDDRMNNPRDDLITLMAHAQINGAPMSRGDQLGTLVLVVLAGADTTWSSIGATLWHLGSVSADRDRLVAHPELTSRAVEEFLRVYAPVTMARVTTTETVLAGRVIGANERVLLPFPAANRDPAIFEDPDQFVLDRRRNRHLTFGSGIHRCIGASLARLEMQVTIEEWLGAMPSFHVLDPAEVAWTAGSVRGPVAVPFRI